MGRPVPFPSVADAGFLAAIPLAVAGLMVHPSAPATLSGRFRLLLDGGIVATSAIFVAWAVGLSDLYVRTSLDEPSKLLALAYPAGDIVLLTLIASALVRAAGPIRLVLGLLFIAFLANLIADGSFVFLQLSGEYGLLGSAGDVGWVAGYLLLALAALSAAAARVKLQDQGEIEAWELAIPWLAVFAVMATSFSVTLSGRQFGPEMGFIGVGFGVLFVASQALALVDYVRVLRRSRTAEAQLRERTALLGEIFSRAPLGIARIGDDFRFLDANARLCEMLALPLSALIGASMSQFLAEDELDRVHERQDLMRNGKLPHVDVDGAMRCADGTTLWVHRSVTPVFNSSGKLTYYLVMFEDISTKHGQEQLALANLTALERLSSLKSEFMSMVSHEFRTALTGIQGYSELMSSQEVEPTEVKEFAGDINADALRLNRMITEMLDLDRIESGRMVMHMEPVDLNQILTDAVDRARMTSNTHAIVLSLDRELPRIQGDSDRLTQVLANLLSNAVKYSPDGGEIEVATRRAGANVEVAVRDHGPGIAPEFIGRIFGRYERYDSGKNQPVGTGLGLAIAQQIIQLHNGRIWVESTLGAGTTFAFALPVPVVSGAAVALR